VITTANITMQFGVKPLFENISVRFGQGNRYGLIGANGSGKSTLMKILGGDLEPTAGTVSIDVNERVGKLRQDQFAFEEFSVIDTVIMGHAELWEIKQERDRIYGLAEMSEEEGMKVAELEIQFAELDGYSAESRAGELLLVPLPRAGNCGCYWRRPCLPIPTSCCWMSRPITSTSTPSVGWKVCSMNATAP
jgi:ATPase subunit of ABC transporter with duplicated ATPase domains